MIPRKNKKNLEASIEEIRKLKVTKYHESDILSQCKQICTVTS